MGLYATDYQILRNVVSDGKVAVPLPRKPVRVATLMNEKAFLEKGAMIHHKTVFLEDEIHDWDWRDGYFRYYSRIVDADDVADVVVAFEVRKD